MIQSEYGISVNKTDHSIKKNIQEYWRTKTKGEVRFLMTHFLVDTYFEMVFFVATSLIVEKKINHMGDTGGVNQLILYQFLRRGPL